MRNLFTAPKLLSAVFVMEIMRLFSYNEMFCRLSVLYFVIIAGWLSSEYHLNPLKPLPIG